MHCCVRVTFVCCFLFWFLAFTLARIFYHRFHSHHWRSPKYSGIVEHPFIPAVSHRTYIYIIRVLSDKLYQLLLFTFAYCSNTSWHLDHQFKSARKIHLWWWHFLDTPICHYAFALNIALWNVEKVMQTDIKHKHKAKVFMESGTLFPLSQFYRLLQMSHKREPLLLLLSFSFLVSF